VFLRAYKSIAYANKAVGHAIFTSKKVEFKTTSSSHVTFDEVRVVAAFSQLHHCVHQVGHVATAGALRQELEVSFQNRSATTDCASSIQPLWHHTDNDEIHLGREGMLKADGCFVVKFKMIWIKKQLCVCFQNDLNKNSKNSLNEKKLSVNMCLII